MTDMFEENFWIETDREWELLHIYTYNGEPYLFCTENIELCRKQADKISDIMIHNLKQPKYKEGDWLWIISKYRNEAYVEKVT